jgi:hypothetical protein
MQTLFGRFLSQSAYGGVYRPKARGGIIMCTVGGMVLLAVFMASYFYAVEKRRGG